MSTPFIGQICIFPYNWAPQGFLPCDGSIYAIQSYQALYSLIGAVYGGDGKTTFAVPDLRGQVAVGLGLASGSSTTWTLGAKHGSEKVALTSTNYLPVHNHNLMLAALLANTGVAAAGAMLGAVLPSEYWTAPASSKNTTFPPFTLGGAYGPGNPHENRQPYLVLNPCIAWDGEYPTLNY